MWYEKSSQNGQKKLSIPDCISYVESNRFKIASLLNSLCYLPSIFLWHFCGKCQSKPLKEKMASSCVMWYVNWTLHNKYLSEIKHDQVALISCKPSDILLLYISIILGNILIIHKTRSLFIWGHEYCDYCKMTKAVVYTVNAILNGWIEKVVNIKTLMPLLWSVRNLMTDHYLNKGLLR